MMTEDEAGTKWCPMVRITPGDDNWHRLTNREDTPLRNVDPPGASRCIGNSCMAWRWGEESDGWDPPTMRPAYRRTAIKDSPGHFDNAPLGFCGLAGRP